MTRFRWYLTLCCCLFSFLKRLDYQEVFISFKLSLSVPYQSLFFFRHVVKTTCFPACFAGSSADRKVRQLIERFGLCSVEDSK